MINLNLLKNNSLYILLMLDSMLEVFTRTLIIFFLTFALMRLRGNRQLAQLTIFDLIIIIGLGSAVGDAMIYTEEVVPLINSVTAIATLVFLVLIIENLLPILPVKMLRVLEGGEVVLIQDGVVDLMALRKTNLHEEELKSRLRQKNIHHYSQVRVARLEPDGTISVTRVKNGNNKDHKKKKK